MMQRKNELMKVQQESAFAWCESKVGQKLQVMIDRRVPDQEQAWIGRSYGDAPDVDGLVFVTAVQQEVHAGKLVEVEVVGTHDYDLIAVS